VPTVGIDGQRLFETQRIHEMTAIAVHLVRIILRIAVVNEVLTRPARLPRLPIAIYRHATKPVE
jgi:hypothetical protein